MHELPDDGHRTTGSRRIGLAALLVAATMLIASGSATAASDVQIDGSEAGPALEGIGGISDAGSSRLLFDYPPARRAEVLDRLFCSPTARPARGYCTRGMSGAALQRLKVEIGADSSAEIGAEPSIERERGVVECNVGWEFKLMAEARKRNPGIRLDALAWSWPGWINPTGQSLYDRVFSSDTITYLLHYLGCAARNGTPIDTLGVWNEVRYLTDARVQAERWIVRLRHALDSHGYSRVQLIIDDGFPEWRPAEICAQPQTADDDAFCDAVSIIGHHYPNLSSYVDGASGLLGTGKPLMATEDAAGLYNVTGGVDFYHDPILRGDWPGARYLAQITNTNYVRGAISGALIYTLLSGYYDQAQFAKGGLMTADTPWARTYDVQSRIWVAAHTTQFTQPGRWRYVGNPAASPSDTSSCFLGTPSCSDPSGQTGSYVTLRAIHGSDYAIVVETKDATAPQDERFCLSGGLAASTVHVWQTDEEKAFAKVADLEPSGGCFSYTLAPDAIYTFTGQGGRRPGAVTQGFQESPLALPYHDDFQGYVDDGKPMRTQARHFIDQQGGFETGHRCPPGGRRWCLRQVVETRPIEWWCAIGFCDSAPFYRSEPYTVIGGLGWGDYEVQARLTASSGDSASVLGRLQRSRHDFDFAERARYEARVTSNGDHKWSYTLFRVDPGGSYVPLKSGSYSNRGRWVIVKLRMVGDRLSVLLDGTPVAEATDGTYTAGMAGLATGSEHSAGTYDTADFDDFCAQAPGDDRCVTK
jgi:hypothetical protein